MLFLGQTHYSNYQKEGHFRRLEAYKPEGAFLQMEPRRARFFEQTELLNSEDEYMQLFKKMGGLSDIEYETTRSMFGVDLSNPRLQAFLRLYNLIPTREQHETILKLKEMGVPYVCIDQNPLAIWLRWLFIDKGDSAHKLLLDKDKTLNERIMDFVAEEDRKDEDMKEARNSIWRQAQERIKYIEKLGLNYYFDDAVTKVDLALLNVAMQFNLGSFNKGFYYPRVFDNVRAIHEYIDEEQPKRWVTVLGIMNLWNVKDQLINGNPDFWVNPKTDLIMDRQGNVTESKDQMVATCNTDKMDEISSQIIKGEISLKRVDTDW